MARLLGTKRRIAEILKRAQKIPLGPTDIGQELGLSKQNVWKHLQQMEAAGCAKESADRKGKYLAP